MRQWGLRLIVAGVALQVIDVITDGKVFGSTGMLHGLDKVIPKMTLPIGDGVQTNVAFWAIAGGAVMYFTG